MQLRDLLANPALGLRLLHAGSEPDALDRPVRWVYTTDLIDPGRYLSGGELVLAGRSGSTLNLIPVDGDAVVDLTGTAWDGQDIQLPRTSARGVSNKVTSDGAKVKVRQGTVLVIVERKKKEYHVT